MEKYQKMIFILSQQMVQKMDRCSASIRAEGRRSFFTTTVLEESQVTPQGRHRKGSNWRPTVSSSMPLPTWTSITESDLLLKKLGQEGQ